MSYVILRTSLYIHRDVQKSYHEELGRQMMNIIIIFIQQDAHGNWQKGSNIVIIFSKYKKGTLI